MRGYKYRAKDLDNNWVFGNKIDFNKFIMKQFNPDGKEYWIEINKDTICNNSLREDKNGTPIYDKDIVRIQNDKIRLVKFFDRKFDFMLGHYINSEVTKFNDLLIHYYQSDTEVIGNELDNPTLYKICDGELEWEGKLNE